MRQIIHNRKKSKFAMNMRLRLERLPREKIPVYISETMAFNVIEQMRAAFCTAHPWKCIRGQRSGIAHDDLYSLGRIDGYRHIGGPVGRLTVIAMAIQLRNRIA